MSQKETITNPVTLNDYEKSKSKFENEEYSQEEFLTLARLYSESFNDVKEGEIVKGRVVRIQGDNVILDVGFKSEGSVPLSDFLNREVKIGQEVDVVLESVEDQEGNLVLSKSRADFLMIWDKVLKAHETGEILQGKIVKRIKGGMVVDLMGMEAFLPGSQIDIRPIRDFDAFVGQTMDFKVVKVNVPTEKVVVTDSDEEKKRISLSLKKLLPHPWESIEEKIHVGDKVSGRVVSLTDYGAFIEIEKGIEGLIHNSEMSWTQHIKHPSQVVAMGQIVEAVILSLDKEEKKISLGIKQLEPDPWESLMQKYPVGSKHSGIARNFTNFGVFVELEPGVDGLF